MTPRRIAITGATGLIGAALCRRFNAAGWHVHALARRTAAAPAAPNIAPFLCDLPSPPALEALAGCEAVIHTAYAILPADLRRATQINEEGTRALLDAAHRAGVSRFIFLSSMSAHEGATSSYARSKLRLESLLDPARDLVIRPGLVLARDAGLFSRMTQTIRTRRVIPLPSGGRQPLQTIHIDDFCTAVSIATDRGLTGRLTLAHPDPLSLRALLALTAHLLGRRAHFLPVPASPILAALRLAETLHIPLPVTSENLRGLLTLRAADTRPDLARLGFSPRATASSLDDLLQ